MGKKETRSRLETYRAKRAAGRTPEPFGSKATVRPRLFCVQKHAASRLHYDFRLEWGGTLWSWAVPKGPSPNPKVNRLAVQVEDHPVDYADFEGVIPRGEYGAGPVIVWDKGMWVPLDDPDQMESTGKLHFELRGYKLRGVWLLLRTGGKEWLLRKKPDAWTNDAEAPFTEESVLSGRTLEEVRDGDDRARRTLESLQAEGAPRRALSLSTLCLTLAETAEAPFSSPDWLFEIKYDGYRALAASEAGEPALRSRNGMDLTPRFPEVARALRTLPFTDWVVDAELVVLDATGRPNFQALQQRGKLHRAPDVERGAVENPATLFVFDLLGFGGFDLRRLPLWQRKQLLQPLLPRLGPVRFADHVAERGMEMFEHVRSMGLEGLVAKRADSPYAGRRTPHWLKIVVERSGDFVVCGFTAPRGSRQGFGALHLGVYEAEQLVYAGRVGTGFDAQQLETLRRTLEEHSRSEPPCAGNVPAGKEHVWVEPHWVAAVRFKEITRDGLLRAPVFERLRDDKQPHECVRAPREHEPEPQSVVTQTGAAKQAPEDDDTTREPQADTTHEPAPPSHARPEAVSLSNLDKVFWPAEGFTKGDLLEYYRKVSPWLLPYLQDRPLVLTRFPDGIEGKSFYQKNAPAFVPSWIRRVPVWSGSSEREIEYFVCDDERALLYIANMGAILLHVWPSRVQTLQHPDWCILDLDPKDAPFAHVLRLARAIRTLCDEIGLESFVKTTGSTGLHVLLPLGRQCTFEQSRMLAQLVAHVIETEHADIATTRRNPASRGGKVYLDYLQNRHGQLLVAPFSARPLPGAPVSAPLAWDEVTARLTPRKFTIRNLPARLRRQRHDPLMPILEAQPDLLGALTALSRRLEATNSRRKRS